MSERGGAMRIALLHPFAWPDVRRGGERYLDDLAWYLRGQGHHVDVITGTKNAGAVHGTEHGDDVRLRQLPNLVVWRWNVKLREPETFGVRAIPTLLRRRYDVVHALMPTVAVAGALARQNVVCTLIGYPTHELSDSRHTKRRVLAEAIKRSAEVTCLSHAVQADVRDLFGRTPVVLPPGVRTERFRRSSGASGATTPPKSVLFASALIPDKGLDVLLAAFARVGATHPDVRLTLCGPGEPDWAYERVGSAIDAVRDRIDLVGPGDPADLPRRYAEATVTVLPSRNEAFGLALAESLASGTPVVGNRGGGADDIVTPEVGRITNFGDVDGLAAALVDALALAEAPTTADECVARAQLWDWTASIGPQHEAIYREVIARRRGR